MEIENLTIQQKETLCKLAKKLLADTAVEGFEALANETGVTVDELTELKSLLESPIADEKKEKEETAG